MSKKSHVAVTACKAYEYEEIYSCVKDLCRSAGIPDLAGKNVLLKPNILSDAPPEKAITTHPYVIRAMVQFVQEQGGTVYIGDSPALHRSNFTGTISGIEQVCKETGAQWVNFSAETVKVENSQAKRQKKFTVAAIISKVDIIISLPKMKTHQLMFMTGAVKNMFGIIPGLGKSPFHAKNPGRKQFAQCIVDLYTMVTPHFSLMDGIVAMEGPGPNSGDPRHMGVLLASTDALALDMTAAYIMGYDPLSIPILQCGIARGLTQASSIPQIEFPLQHPDSFLKQDFKRIDQQQKPNIARLILGPLAVRFLPNPLPKPLFNNAVCIQCGKCVRICPAGALNLDSDSGITIDYKACVRCYCCHEICPADAIAIEVQVTAPGKTS